MVYAAQTKWTRAIGKGRIAYSFLMELTTALVKGDDVGDSDADIVE